jgi:hypothetical protein
MNQERIDVDKSKCLVNAGEQIIMETPPLLTVLRKHNKMAVTVKMAIIAM